MNKTHSGKYNLLMAYILQVANFLFPLITYPYVTRTLGVEHLGEIGFAGAISNCFAAIATFGITSYAVRTCAKEKREEGALVHTVKELFTANAVTTVIAVSLFAFTMIVIPSIRLQWKYMLIFGMGFATEFLGMGWLYTAMEQFTYITVRNLIFKSLSIVCIFLFVRDSSDALIYAGITVFSVVGINIINYICARRFTGTFVRFTTGFGRHYHRTKWFFVQSIALTILSNMDVSMLGFLSSGTQVGNYEAALKIKLLLSAVVSSLGNVFLPRLSRNYSRKDMVSYWNSIRKSLRYNCVISLPMLGFLLIGADDAMLLFCGSEYIYAADILKVLSIAVFLIGVSTVTGIQSLLSMEKEKELFWSLVTGSIVNFILNFCLIPKYHGVGAAIATVCSETVILGVQLIFLKRLGVSIPLLKVILKPFIGTVGSFFITAVVSLICPFDGMIQLFVLGICFVLAYGIILLLLKEEIIIEVKEVLFGRKKNVSGN